MWVTKEVTEPVAYFEMNIYYRACTLISSTFDKDIKFCA
jgi:hypothetical protein